MTIGALLAGLPATGAVAQTPDNSLTLPTIDVVAPATPRSAGSGAPDTGDAASAFTVSGDKADQRIASRPGEVLEVVPGLIVTQHSGEGKANQYFLRGFNLDHGTDLAITVDGMPVNMRTHAHGQGYADLNFLMPELVGAYDIKKGVYSAREGDFSSAGAVHINLIDTFDGVLAKTTMGSFGSLRTLGLGAVTLGEGTLLYAGEVGTYGGPWLYPDDLRKLNTVLRYARGTAENGFSVTGMAYDNRWHSSDQIPQRAVAAGETGLYGALDPTDGGNTQRFSLSARGAESNANGAWKANAYAIRSALNLWNDFTYFLTDPDKGDQFHQHETRTVAGANASYTWKGSVLGRPFDTEVGVQTRYDDINLLLTNTAGRQYLSTIRQDHVREGSVGVFVENRAQWTDWFRTVLGWRGDVYAASDEAFGTPVNSGRPAAFIGSPKASFVFGPFARTEVFVDLGEGFHSNDVRGVTIQQEPSDPTQRLQAAPFLTRTKGAEVGFRMKPVEGLVSSVAVFVLDAASENLFSGDAGDTQATTLPTRRVGIEWATTYEPVSWLSLDADVAYTRARFLGYDAAQAATYVSLAGYPHAQIGNAPGSYVPGAATSVASFGLTLGEKTGWFAGLQYRFFGPRPLTEDNAFRSPATGLLDARLGYRFENGWFIQLDGFNLANSRSDQITYAYGSLIKSDSLYALCTAPASPVPAAVCQNGVMDRVFKPVEPLALRLTVAGRF